MSVPDGRWDHGYTGGIFDPTVLDSGADLTQPALQDKVGREDFYS